MRSDDAATGSPLVNLAGVSVLVTGGSTGIGAAVVATAHQLGARVAVVDLLAPDGIDVPHAEADVSSADEVRAAVAEVATKLGGLDVLVNNAGIAPADRFEDISDE